MTDLSNLDTSGNKPQTLVLTSPVDDKPLMDDSGKQISIELLGVDSDEYRKARASILARRLNQASKKGRIKFETDEMEEEAIGLLVKVTKSWSGIKVNGQILECSQQNVELVYKKFPWVREQVETFINDRANFLGNSSRNLSTSSGRQSGKEKSSTTEPQPTPTSDK